MILLLLSGCLTRVFFPPDLWVWSDSGRGRDPGANSFDLATGECDDQRTQWTWTVRSEGWMESGQLTIFRLADNIVEEQPMTLWASDPNGAWDEYGVGPVADSVDPAVQEAGVNTRFDCLADRETLTSVARFRDADDALVDCVIFGQDLEGGLAAIRAMDPDVTTIGGCRTITQ